MPLNRTGDADWSCEGIITMSTFTSSELLKSRPEARPRAGKTGSGEFEGPQVPKLAPPEAQ
eukprot:6276164-Lingulodinium_polyedra.AAC.1